MSLLASWLASPPPDAAVEITPTWVSAATMTSRRGGPAIQSYAVEGAARARCCRVACVAATSSTAPRWPLPCALSSAGWRRDRRVWRWSFPTSPPGCRSFASNRCLQRRDDLDQLVRWQMRKAAPFPIDDASVTYSPGARGADGSAEFVVVLARSDVVKGYEDVCADAGLHAGLVDIATFGVVNLALAAARSTDGRLARRPYCGPTTRRSPSSAAGDLIFFRNRPEDDEESLTDVVHQTAMYYQDRLAGQGFARVLLGGISGRRRRDELATRASRNGSARPWSRSIRPRPRRSADRITATSDLHGRAVAAGRRAAAHAGRGQVSA